MQTITRIEKICANLFLLCLTIFLVVAVAEIVLKKTFRPNYRFAIQGVLQGRGDQLQIQLNEKNLYTIKANASLGINKHGYRDRDFTHKQKGKKRICFLGDSFVMGLNVKSEETLPKVLEKKLNGVEVYNMGVVGFGPDQALNVLQDTALRLKPDLVIQGIYAGNDSEDILKNGLYTTGGDEQLRLAKSNPVKLIVFSSPFAIINMVNFIKTKQEIVNRLDSILFSDSQDLSWVKGLHEDSAKYKLVLMRTILAKTRDVLNQNKTGYLAVIIPSPHGICDDGFFQKNGIEPDKYFFNESMYQFMLEAKGIPFVNLTPYFMRLPQEERCSLYTADGHLSRVGNQFSAEIIKGALNEKSF